MMSLDVTLFIAMIFWIHKLESYTYLLKVIVGTLEGEF